MDALWASFLASKVGRWLAMVGGFLLALAIFALYVWRKATKHQADTDEAKDAAEQVQAAHQIQHAAQTRAEVESETAKLPDAPAQTVATADPATAAGELRTDGWVRPAGTDGH